MKTFNKRGDKGETSLLYGGRISKGSLRVEAYGKLDEVVSMLGLARNLVKKEKTQLLILKAQKELFLVSAELATAPDQYQKLASGSGPITEAMVDTIERTINELESEIEVPKSFVIPGANPGSAALDLARSMTRTAERRAVSLKATGEIENGFILSYLNRLADLLFTLARYEES